MNESFCSAAAGPNLSSCMTRSENETEHYECDAESTGILLTKTWFRVLIYFFYMSIFFIALLGNGLVCYVFYANSRMRTLTNYFIVNLAVGDILIALFCVPTTFISTLILMHWPFGFEICVVVNFLQAVSVLVSAYTLVAISVDRYVAIQWPFRPKMRRKKHARVSICAVWMLALFVSFPIAIVSKLLQPSEQYRACDQYVCQEDWQDRKHRYYYSMALMVVQYVIPLVTLLFTYTSIALLVWGKRPPGEAENARDQRLARSKLKMVKMMMIVVLVFTICWLPYNALMIYLDQNDEIAQWEGLPYVWGGLHWLAMSHACYNPVIYCWMNNAFRAAFKSIFSRMPVIRLLVPRHDNHGACNTSVAGIALTGFDGQNFSGLRRINTYTTYVSFRRKTNNYGLPTRSSSFRCNNSIRASIPSQRNVVHLEVQPEESI